MPFEAFEESLRLNRLLRKLVHKLRSRDLVIVQPCHWA